MDSAVPSTAVLWKRLCKQWSWLINSGAFVLGMCGGCFVLASVSLVIVMEESGIVGSKRPFDSATWKQNQSSPFVIPIRYRMSHDLIVNHALVGKTMGEIEEMLGAPDSLFGGEHFAYLLRPEISDDIYLMFEITNEAVSDVQITYHYD